VFSIFFEIVSAYGNVGLSLGYPTNSASLSGQFTVFSKLVVCAMMIRGRHRELPHALDRAITLPIEQNDERFDSREMKNLRLDRENEKRDWESGGRTMSKAYTQ
jgi:Trk-type K+ transport system membrane component